MRLFFIIGTIFFALCVADARAEIISQQSCTLFTGKSGMDKVKFCPTTATVYRRAAHPIEIDGKVWGWIARVQGSSQGRKSDSHNAYIYVENFRDWVADGNGKSIGKALGTGYRIRYFNEAGKVLWDKEVVADARIVDKIISHDGSLIVLVVSSRTGYADVPTSQSPEEYWVTVYNREGVKLFDFPKRSEVCDFTYFSKFWISKTGRYMMVPCGKFREYSNSYFFRPKAGMYWHADKAYEVEKMTNASLYTEDRELEAEDEHYGRIVVRAYRNIHNGASSTSGINLVLNGVGWRPLRELK